MRRVLALLAACTPASPPTTSVALEPQDASIEEASTERAPRLRVDYVTVNGYLSPRVVDDIVKANASHFRPCWDTFPNDGGLTGRVVVKFIVGRDGSVTMSQDGGSTLSDPRISTCVYRMFSNLAFPEPDGGIFPSLYTFEQRP